MTTAELNSELARLRAENAALKARPAHGLRAKVSEKGGVSVYGLGRWPVTLYRNQWQRLFEFSPELRDFILQNEARLSVKD